MISIRTFLMLWGTCAAIVVTAVTFVALRHAKRLAATVAPTARQQLKSAGRRVRGRHASPSAPELPLASRIPAPRRRSDDTVPTGLALARTRDELTQVLGCTEPIHRTTDREAPTMPRFTQPARLYAASLRRLASDLDATRPHQLGATSGARRRAQRDVSSQWEVVCHTEPPMVFPYAGENAERDARGLFDSDAVTTSTARWSIRTRIVITETTRTPWRDAGEKV